MDNRINILAYNAWVAQRDHDESDDQDRTSEALYNALEALFEGVESIQWEVTYTCLRDESHKWTETDYAERMREGLYGWSGEVQCPECGCERYVDATEPEPR